MRDRTTLRNLVLSSSVFVLIFVYSVVGDEVADFVAKGDTALRENRYEDALEAYSNAIGTDPSNFNVYYKRAGLYLLRGKNFQALADLNKVLESNPSFTQARLRRGKVYLSMGKFNEAKDEYNYVLKHKPDNELAKTQLEVVDRCSRDFAAAKEVLESADRRPEQLALAADTLKKVLETASDSVDARILHGRLALEAKRYHEVLEDAMAVLKQKSANTEALYLRGRAFYFLGEREAAIKHYRQCLSYDPDNSQCRSEFKRLDKLEQNTRDAAALLEQGKATEALALYIEAIALEPDNNQVTPSLYLGKCKCHLKLKQLDEAITACTQVIAMDEGLVDAYITRADAHGQKDDWDKAVYDYQKAREKQPQNRQVNEGLQNAMRQQKMAARKDYYKILGLGKTASDQEIRKAYRKLALEWHPDKHDGDMKKEAEQKYVEIAEAYEILSNEESRRRYDSGEDINVGPQFNPFQQAGGSPFHFTFHFG